MDLWDREAIGNGVVSDDWGPTMTELGQTVVSATIVILWLAKRSQNPEILYEIS